MAFHDTIGWEGPKKVVEEFVYRSKSFRRVALVGSITVGEKTAAASARDRMKSTYVLGLKRAYEFARRAPVPPPLRKLASRIVSAIQ